MKRLADIPLSVLDLSPIVEGGTIADSFRNSVDLARHVEKLGYTRFWLAEHHNIPGIASAATSVLIGHVPAGTTTLRVGSGGIMLPNHAPLVIAEQFGTLEALYPGRIDLGLGRAPGTDQVTSRALRRDPTAADDFPDQVQELITLLGRPNPAQRIKAIQHLQRAPGGFPRAALRVRRPFRSAPAARSPQDLSREFPSLSPLAATVRDGGRTGDRGG